MRNAEKIEAIETATGLKVEYNGQVRGDFYCSRGESGQYLVRINGAGVVVYPVYSDEHSKNNCAVPTAFCFAAVKAIENAIFESAQIVGLKAEIIAARISIDQTIEINRLRTENEKLLAGESGYYKDGADYHFFSVDVQGFDF